ncbi:hypothetical protein PO909_014626 [Leuciscus waleckii]
MLTAKRIFECVRPQDWFAAIDLKDAYFHVSILPRHRPFLRFAFEGQAYQYAVLPFGLALSPRVFTKVVEAALVPLREHGVRILNYLDDWLILAHSRDQVCEHRDLVLRHLARLGLRVNWEKSKLCPVQRISFLGMDIDSVAMCAQLTSERAQSLLTCLRQIRGQECGPTETLSEAPGAYGIRSRSNAARIASYETASALASRSSPEVGMATWHAPSPSDSGLPSDLHPVVEPQFSTGRSPQRLWHVNCLELLAVRLALHRFRALLRGQHVLVRSDNTATVAYINRQGGLRSRRMSQLARHLLIWSQKHLRSLRAIYIPGELNRAADELSRFRPLAGEWRLHPQSVQLIWDQFGDAQIDLFASHDSSHCDLFYSLTEGTLGTDALAHSWPRGLRKYAFPPVSLLAQTLRKIREDEEQVILVAPYWPNRTWFPELVLLATAPPWPIPLRKDLLSQGRGTLWHPHPDLWNLHVWLLDGTSVVLSFLQEGLERRLSPSTLKVYVAAIAAHHDAVEGKSLGKHDLIIRFLRGARRLNPPRPPLVPSWDLSVVLTALQSAPFEPLQSVELKSLSMKTALLVALVSIKRVGDLQAFSVDEACLEFGPANSHAFLRPRPGYVPKVPTTPFRDQVVNLQALPLEEADPALALLCPVRALRAYVDRMQCFRTSDQLFVCHGGKLKGKALSKQRLSHWIVDAIALAYQQQGRPCPLGVTAHSTRSVASSWALAHGASLTDICRAAGWATPNTFARFYNLRVEPVSSHVLASTSRCMMTK